MNKIKNDELYRNLSSFLAGKGIELKDGAYASRIRRGCSLLADCINFAQSSVENAKTKMDSKLDRMRQVIHDKTAPKKTAPAAAASPEPEPAVEEEQKPKPKPRRTVKVESRPARKAAPRKKASKSARSQE